MRLRTTRSAIAASALTFMLASASASACGGGGVGDNNNTGDDASTDPLVLVPPVRLTGDPATDCPAAYQTAPTVGQNDGFESGGQTRGFYLQLPGAEFTGPRPLLIQFNGTGGDGQWEFQSSGGQTFVDNGFITVGPDSIANGTLWPVWDALRQIEDVSPNLDLTYFDDLVACVAAHFEVDAKRIYIAGHSAGGLFSNRVLRSRSELLAGGIPASGVYDLTTPVPEPPLDPMAVAVTWGGYNDEYSGSASGVQVPEINFAEQGTIASAAYEAAPGVHQVWCMGEELGHTWLDQATGWLVDFLLAHPKGIGDRSPWTFMAPDESANYTCGTEAATYIPMIEVSCDDATTTVAECNTYCQYLGDCVVENGSVAAIMGPQMLDLGFTGTDNSECGGCLDLCEADVATGAATEMAVLDCLETGATAAGGTCGPGITGVMPMVAVVDDCCDGELGSAICGRICTSIMTNDTASAFFPSCTPWAP